MPRPAHIIPRDRLTLRLPEDLRARLDLMLVSELEGRVPLGAYSELFIQLLRAHFEHEDLDLSPFSGAQPGTLIVRGPPQAIQLLRRLLSA